MPGYQDTVHSYKPSIPITYSYHLKPGESFYKDRNGKVTITHSKNEQVSKDTRNDWQKQQDNKNASGIRKQKQMNQAEHETVQLASNILDRVRPSKLATAVVKGQKPMDYVDNGNEGTGNEIVNTGFDILSTLGLNNLLRIQKIPIGKIGKINSSGAYNNNYYNALELTKDRLRNGGFDRLADAQIDGIITGEAPSYSQLLFKSLSDPEIQQTILNKQPLIGKAKEVEASLKKLGINSKQYAENGGIGSSHLNNGGYYTVYTDNPDYTKSALHNNEGVAHEYAHYVTTPSTNAPGFNYENDEYWLNSGGKSGEIMARGTQLKNYFKLKEGESITPKMFEYAKQHYIKDTGLNNDMTDFFNRVIDVNKFLPWLNKNAPIIGVPILYDKAHNKTLH